jgi:hypothetical protein
VQKMETTRFGRQSACRVKADWFLKDLQPPPSPNTQLALEQGAASIDWSTMPNDPLLGNNDLVRTLLS